MYTGVKVGMFNAKISFFFPPEINKTSDVHFLAFNNGRYFFLFVDSGSQDPGDAPTRVNLGPVLRQGVENHDILASPLHRTDHSGCSCK